MKTSSFLCAADGVFDCCRGVGPLDALSSTSTQLMRDLGDAYGDLLADHRRLLREHLGRADGREIDTQGDAFFFCFTRARDAVVGAVAAQLALVGHEWRDGVAVRVRMGLHTGEPTVGAEGYHGLDVRAARICAVGHGGRVRLSETTRALIGEDLPEGVDIVDLGRQDLAGFSEQRLFRLSIAGAPSHPPESSASCSSSSSLGFRLW